MKINKSTCKKKMQQRMQQKLERLQFRVKIFFSTGNNIPCPLLIYLTKSIFFLLFLPKYTEWILEEKIYIYPFSCSCLSFHHRAVFNTISKPICHRLCFQKKNSILSFPILSLLLPPLGHGLSYQSI